VAYAENFRGGAKLCNNRVTSQINFRGSAEGTTILGGPVHAPGKILQNYTEKYPFLCVLEASFRPEVTNMRPAKEFRAAREAFR